MKKQSGISRRRFLGNSALLSGAAVGASSLSLAARGMSRQSEGKAKVFKPAPLFDPSLENYPGYSARIPAPPVNEPEDGQGDSLFTGM